MTVAICAAVAFLPASNSHVGHQGHVAAELTHFSHAQALSTAAFVAVLLLIAACAIVLLRPFVQRVRADITRAESVRRAFLDSASSHPQSLRDISAWLARLQLSPSYALAA